MKTARAILISLSLAFFLQITWAATPAVAQATMPAAEQSKFSNLVTTAQNYKSTYGSVAAKDQLKAAYSFGKMLLEKYPPDARFVRKFAILTDDLAQISAAENDNNQANNYWGESIEAFEWLYRKDQKNFQVNIAFGNALTKWGLFAVNLNRFEQAQQLLSNGLQIYKMSLGLNPEDLYPKIGLMSKIQQIETELQTLQTLIQEEMATFTSALELINSYKQKNTLAENKDKVEDFLELCNDLEKKYLNNSDLKYKCAIARSYMAGIEASQNNIRRAQGLWSRSLGGLGRISSEFPENYRPHLAMGEIHIARGQNSFSRRFYLSALTDYKYGLKAFEAALPLIPDGEVGLGNNVMNSNFQIMQDIQMVNEKVKEIEAGTYTASGAKCPVSIIINNTGKRDFFFGDGTMEGEGLKYTMKGSIYVMAKQAVSNGEGSISSHSEAVRLGWVYIQEKSEQKQNRWVLCDDTLLNTP